MASHSEMRRRSSAADRVPIASLSISSATTTTFAQAQDANKPSQDQANDDLNDAEAMPPPPLPATGDASPVRPSLPTSPASRNANRLSLTLPIAPPTSDPSRPTPTSSVPRSSVPPTPVEPSGEATPSDADDFIIAIAAQERRVLELREELARAEKDLSSLKKKWSTHNPLKKKREPAFESPRPSPTVADDESISSRRSVDLERRKSLLQSQNSFPQGRRRVMRGGHTRTLSLLSPTKTTGEFAVHDELNREPLSLPLPPVERRTEQLLNPSLSKRASWQPHTNLAQAGMPQFVEDFRSGLKAFVEDIRQITVGDEPINGQNGRLPSQRTSEPGGTGDYDTVRPGNSSVARPTASSAFDTPGSSAASTPTPTSKSRDALAKERVKMTRNKHFSWTPLSFDSIDDSDWSNWDSPAPAKSPRWSGSTINNGAIEDIQAIPEALEETDEAGKGKSAGVEAPMMSPKLEEILPSVVNRLTPSNIKRTANNFLDEWEKSLSSPESSKNKENSV